MIKTGRFHLLFTLLGGLLLLFIIAPLLGMFLATTPHEFFTTAQDKEVIRSIWLTLWTAMMATLVSGIGAIPLAYLLARRHFRLKRFVLGLIDLPIVIPHTAAGIAVLGFISRNSVVGKAASLIGLNFVGHPAGIAVAMAFVSLPYLLNAARDGFSGVPLRLEQAALNLGTPPGRVFFTIALPLAWRNIVSGLIMMFARGMSEFGAVIIIAYHPMITPVLIYERFGAFGLKYARPVSVIFILVSLVFFIILRLLSKEKKNA
jgi:molybdate/tungstate transport system permease protein